MYFLDNLYGNYFSVMSMEVGDEIHITRDPNYNSYESYLLIASRDAQGPIFMGVLSGGSNGEHLRGVKLLPIVSDINNSIKIKDSTNTTPLILSSTYRMVLYSFIPCNTNPKNKLKIELVKKPKI